MSLFWEVLRSASQPVTPNTPAVDQAGNGELASQHPRNSTASTEGSQPGTDTPVTPPRTDGNRTGFFSRIFKSSKTQNSEETPPKISGEFLYLP